MAKMHVNEMHETVMRCKGDRGFMLSLAHGKYVIFYNWSHEGQFKCQRYGMNWRDFTGDKMMMELCQVAMGKLKEEHMDPLTCACGKPMSKEDDDAGGVCSSCWFGDEPDGAQMAHNEMEERAEQENGYRSGKGE